MTRAQTGLIVTASLACLALAGWAYAGTGPGYGKYLASCQAHHVLEQCNRSLRLWKEQHRWRVVALVYLVALGAVVVLAIASVQARAGGDVRAPGPYACGLGPCQQPPQRKPQ